MIDALQARAPADAASVRRPALSIVVASRRGEGDVRSCLESLRPQVDESTEVILVEDGPADGPRPDWVRRYERPDGLVPELWAEGLTHTTGRLVALTAGSLVPHSGWIDRTLEAHNTGAVAVGGPIEPGPRMGIVDWAVYLCRYSAYMAPLPTGDVSDLPGDNASYDGDVLHRYRRAYADGFWEPFVHRSMVADGHALRVDPSRVVHHAAGSRVAAFSRQRFRHGQRHGRLRAGSLGRLEILARIAALPLVPLLLTVRVARNALDRKRHIRELAVATPLVLWFFSCWAVGEAASYVAALRRTTAGADR